MDDDYELRVPRDEKTKWKDDIKESLLRPNYASSWEDFFERVEEAKDVVALTYPNWDAYTEVNDEVAVIKKKWDVEFNNWFSKNQPMKSTKKYRMKKQCRYNLNYEILIFIRNYCAKKGMLSEGPRESRAIPYEEKDESKNQNRGNYKKAASP